MDNEGRIEEIPRGEEALILDAINFFHDIESVMFPKKAKRLR
jgi:hypothetical protein